MADKLRNIGFVKFYCECNQLVLSKTSFLCDTESVSVYFISFNVCVWGGGRKTKRLKDFKSYTFVGHFELTSWP